MIAISRHVKESLVERMDLEADRVDVIHLGLDHDLFRPGEEREPFLLYPANPGRTRTTAPLRSVTRLRREHPGLRLVLTGTGLERLSPPEGVGGPPVPREQLAALTDALRRSSSRASTKGSASRRSRRWPQVVRRVLDGALSRRSAPTPPATSTRCRSTRWSKRC